MSTDTASRTIAFWDCDPGAEQLCHTEITEAVEEWADRIHPDPLPETVTVYGYAKMALPSAETLARDQLDRLLECLDEDFGDPEGHGTDATPTMKDAALRFVASICAEYESWMCEQVTSEVVRVADHVPAEWMPPERASVPAVD